MEIKDFKDTIDIVDQRKLIEMTKNFASALNHIELMEIMLIYKRAVEREMEEN